MKRLRVLDIALLVIFVPLWLGCFALHVREVRRGRLAWVPIIVSQPAIAEDYPTVREFWPGTETQTSGLMVGDRLVRLGDADLRGVGPIGFVARAYEQADTKLQVPVSFMRAGEQHASYLSLIAVAVPWRMSLLALGIAVTAVLVLLRTSGSPAARTFFLAGMFYSLHWTYFSGGSRVQTYAWIIIFLCSSVVMHPLILRTVLIFPEEIVPTGIRMPAWPWLFALFGLFTASWVFGALFSSALGLRGIFVMNILFLVTLLVLLTHNYRRAGPVGRRQLKWVVYGIYIGTVPALAASVVTAFVPSLWWIYEISMIAHVLVPICLCIAIFRYNLFDIDRLISSTTAYSILFMVLIGGALLGGPQLVQVMSGVVGGDPATGQNFLQLLIVALVVPGQRYLHPWIERFFFPERQALEHGVEHLLHDLSLSEEPKALLSLLSERLYVLLQPECCVTYGRVDEAYVPTFVRGNAVPPVIVAESALVGALRGRAVPVDVERWRRTARVHVDSADRAVVDNLRAVVILPLGHTEPLAAFVSLGRKRSGDIYTQTDYVLLSAVVDKVADELLRFAEAENHQKCDQVLQRL